MTPERWQAIIDGIWAVEIGLDSAMCNDSGNSEEVKILAEWLLADATRLRKAIVRQFGQLAESVRPSSLTERSPKP
jgi:hypothetical protein